MQKETEAKVIFFIILAVLIKINGRNRVFHELIVKEKTSTLKSSTLVQLTQLYVNFTFFLW